MNPEKIFARAEAWKKKSHRLSLNLRLKSVADARRFLRELGVVLWNGKAELPNLLDAILGRIANGQERNSGKPAEQCNFWRSQILKDVEFLDCRFFCKMATSLYQDFWPYATVFAVVNRQQAEDGSFLSRDAKRIVNFLKKEGPTASDLIQKSLRYNSAVERRQFQKAKIELQNRLIVLSIQNSQDHPAKKEVVDFWESQMPKSIRNKAEQISEKDARSKLLSAALNVSVLSNEKKIRNWFYWSDGDWSETVETLVQKKDFMRIQHKKTSWIIPRKVLTNNG